MNWSLDDGRIERNRGLCDDKLSKWADFEYTMTQGATVRGIIGHIQLSLGR
jgi:hypothetical protein